MLRIALISLLSVLIFISPVYALTPEDAVKQLDQLGLYYSADSLIAAAKADDVRAVDLLMAAGMDPNAADGDAPALIQAAEQGHTAIVETLLEHGANVNAIDPSNQKTGLYYAIENEHPETALLLLQDGADPNIRGPEGITPLMLAAQQGDDELTRILVERGADINMQADNGLIALGFAIQAGHEGVARVLQYWHAVLEPGPVITPAPVPLRILPGRQLPISELLKHTQP